MKIKVVTIIIALFFSLSVYSERKSNLSPHELKCEYIKSPVGLDILKPRFSWINKANTNSSEIIKQTAYRIIVSNSKLNIDKNIGVMWDSGWIKSEKSHFIEYNGKALTSDNKYYWKVQVKDEKGIISDFSDTATWSTGLFLQSEWKASWITSPMNKPLQTNEELYNQSPNPIFRKEFKVARKVRKASLYISGLGYYVALINGNNVSENMLDPGWTNYDKTILYSTFDVTNLLTEGNNMLGITLGNGWYNPLPFYMWCQDFRNVRNYLPVGNPVLKAQLKIEYSDNDVEYIHTDNTWEFLNGGIIHNDLYLGEIYDAGKVSPNWSTINFDGNISGNAIKTDGPKGLMTSQKQPSIRIIERIQPKSINKLKDNTYIVDMGKNFAGILKIKVKGERGRRIDFRYGEDIYPDGSLNGMTAVAGQIKVAGCGGPGAPDIAFQTDSYILKGDGEEEWQPSFTFHGFRYVEIIGWPGIPSLENFEGWRLSADVDESSSFECSNEMLNKLNEIVDRTFRSNLFSVQSDCPAREKYGYGGDMLCTNDAFIYKYDMYQFYKKVLRDFTDAQRPLGGFTETVPNVGINDYTLGDDSGPISYQAGFSHLLNQLYMYYGDLNVIHDNYESLKKQVDFLISVSKDDLILIDLSDHEALTDKPEPLTASCFYFFHLEKMADFAKLTNQNKDYKYYSTLKEKTRKAIISKFFDTTTGKFYDGTQSSQIIGLWFNILMNKTDNDNALKYYLDVVKKNNYHLSTGIFATKMMFDVLRDNNRNDIAYRIATQNDFPGWFHMINNGATTLWETWKYSDNVYSQNHPMFGSVVEWFYRSLLGINATSPGFKKFIVKPQPTSDLIWAKGHYDSPYGRIKSDWIISGNTYKHNVSVPVNTTAEIWVPANNENSIKESGKAINKNKLIKLTKKEDGYCVFSVEPGEFEFVSEIGK